MFVREDCADPLAEVLDGLERLAGEDRSGWSNAAKSLRVADILEAHERLEAEVLRAVGEWDGSRAWAEDAALSAPSWLAHRAAMSKQRARHLVRAARLAFRNTRTGKALAAGDVSAEQVAVLATAACGREALYARDEDTLVDIAPTLNVDDFTTAAKYWRSAADDELARTDASPVFDARAVTIAHTLGGRCDIQLSLDAEGGAIVERALDAYDRPDPHDAIDGTRTLAQRRADAIVQICSEALREKQHAGHHTTAVECIVDVDRLTTHSDRSPLASRCEIVGAGPVSSAVMDRLTCDASVGRVLMRGASDVLDLGRRARVVSPALRRAVHLRDRHCVFPGCSAPPHWCDVHHLLHWADGGATDLDNCALLCRRHHVACHEGGWHLARGPDDRFSATRT